MLVLLVEAIVLGCVIYSLRSWLTLLWIRRDPKSLPYPPGPQGLPLVGNIFDMPDGKEWEKAAIQWKLEYGDLVFVRNLGKPFIFVNSYDVAIDLFEHRGNNYSSRPHNALIELEGWDWMPSLMQYGEEHRKSRQFLNQFLGKTAVSDYIELQTQVIHRLLLGLLNEPETFRDLIRRSGGEIILMAAYGYKVTEKNDPYIKLADRSILSIAKAEKFPLINVLPWLRYLPKWLPGTGFHEVINEGCQLSHDLLYQLHESTKNDIRDGIEVPSITSRLIEANTTEDGRIVDEPIIAKSTGVAYAAGGDTTVSTLATFVLAMVLYPEAQRRGYEELVRVIGKDNLPTMQDKPNLPYINAICTEALRWQVVAPLGLAHSATEDDVYNGYFIPAGTTILANIWGMQRDPEEYPEPDKFIPERWLPTDGKKTPLDARKTSFGFGRRICPGRHFAENTIFLAVASMLAAFSIEKALDKFGTPITPTTEYVEYFIRHPKPFKCKITPRSDTISATIQNAVESAN